MIIPVEQIHEGDVLLLPGSPGQEVTVYEVTKHAGDFVVSWRRLAEWNEPGGSGKVLADDHDGFHLGSIRGKHAGDALTVLRRARLRRAA